MQDSPGQPAPVQRLGGWLLLGAWFLYFSRDVLGVRFSPDDMMNVDNFYWTPGIWRLVYAQFLIWRGYYRPMGGVFYLPILSLWGLNPAPYHAALSLVLAVNVYLVYRLARLLGAGGWAAGLAALVACYHAGLGNLYYNTAFVYDALCGGFFLASLVYYCGIRSRDRRLSPGQTVIFAVLVLCALNSKEMALTLPAVLLAYEWIYHPSPSAGAAPRAGAAVPRAFHTRLSAWLRGPGSPILLAAFLTLLDLYGKCSVSMRSPAWRVTGRPSPGIASSITRRPFSAMPPFGAPAADGCWHFGRWFPIWRGVRARVRFCDSVGCFWFSLPCRSNSFQARVRLACTSPCWGWRYLPR
jgi:hypothetical protein